MYIKDLQPREGNIELEAEVKDIGDVREFDKFGKKGRVANATISDGTGTVKLSLWNDQIESVKIGDKLKISKGYVSEWQGELQLTTGKFGSLEVIGHAEEGAEKTVDKAEESSKEEESSNDAADKDAEEVPLDIEEEKV